MLIDNFVFFFSENYLVIMLECFVIFGVICVL